MFEKMCSHEKGKKKLEVSFIVNSLISFFYFFLLYLVPLGFILIFFTSIYVYIANFFTFSAAELLLHTVGRKNLAKKRTAQPNYQLNEQVKKENENTIELFTGNLRDEQANYLDWFYNSDLFNKLYYESYFTKSTVFFDLFFNEIILLFFLLLLTLIFTFRKKSFVLFSITGEVIFLLSLFLLYVLYNYYVQYNLLESSYTTFLNQFHISHIRIVFKFFVTLLFLIIMPLSYFYFYSKKLKSFEYPILLGFALWGLLMMLSSFNLIIFFINVEVVTILTIILLGINTVSNKSLEGALKYFIISIISSLIYVFSMFLIYWSIGSLDLNLISEYLFLRSYNELNWILVSGIFGIFIFFLIKLGFVPFYFWLPEIYSSCSLPVLNFLLLPYKTTFFFLFISFFFSYEYFFKITTLVFKPLIIFIIILNLLIFPLLGILEVNLRRLAFFSSGIQLNYILAVLSTVNESTLININYCLIYFIFYTVTNIGFVCLLNINVETRDIYKINSGRFFYYIKNRSLIYINDLKVLNNSVNNNFIKYGSFLVICSLSGLPPFIGFFTKISFLSILFNFNIYLFVLVLFSSTVSLYYYLRLIKVMFFEKFVKYKVRIESSSILYDYYYIIFVFILLSPWFSRVYYCYFEELTYSFLFDISFTKNIMLLNQLF